MKIRYEIYSALFPEVLELSKHISISMQDFGYDGFKVNIGLKIGEVTVTLPEGKTKQEVKTILEWELNKKVTDNKVWLKEVAYEDKNQ
jgi:hypothetical protein